MFDVCTKVITHTKDHAKSTNIADVKAAFGKEVLVLVPTLYWYKKVRYFRGTGTKRYTKNVRKGTNRYEKVYTGMGEVKCSQKCIQKVKRYRLDRSPRGSKQIFFCSILLPVGCGAYEESFCGAP